MAIQTLRLPARGAAACLCLVLATSAARAGDLVLVCYVRQSGSGALQDFTRRLEIDTTARTVAIADDTGHGFQPLHYYGTLLTADQTTISFDYVSTDSSGRTVIDRASGAYRFADGRFITSGTCSEPPALTR